MQLYAHWLDGEFVRLATRSTGPKQNTVDMTRALKLHALLGTQLVLSDVQVFDSAAVLTAFADPEFRDFVTDNRDFLDLRVEPDPAMGTSPFALAARGLARTQVDGWTSSLFVSDPAPIKCFANEILETIASGREVDETTPGRAEVMHPAHQKQLRAARHAIYYFGRHDNPKQLVAPSGARLSYFDVLHQTRRALYDNLEAANILREHSVDVRMRITDQKREDLANIEATLNFIELAIENPDHRKARSRVLRVLGREADLRKRETIWNNVVQAWNYATAQTLQPDGSSVGNLPGAVSLAPYLQKSTDILVPLDVRNPVALAVKPEHLPLLSVDIDAISWKDVARARSETTVTMKRFAQLRYQQAADMDEIVDGLRPHLKAIAKVLTPSQKASKISGTPYAFCIAKSGMPAAVAAVIGLGTMDSLKVGAAALLVDLAKEAYTDFGPWRQKRALTGTLFDAITGRSK